VRVLVEVPTGRYSGVLLTRDTTSLEPDVVEYKLYAPDLGPILAVGMSGGAAREAWSSSTKRLQKTAPARWASPIRSLRRRHSYGSLSIIVKSLMLCES
jgi:hypothetical protein